MTIISETNVRQRIRFLVITAVAVLVVFVGQRLPIPGIDTLAIARCMEYSKNCLTPVSIFALGLSPLLTVLIGFETLKLAVPRLAALDADASGAHRWIDALLAALALVLATVQALAVCQMLTATGFFGDGVISLVLPVATLIAGFAVLLLLTRVLRVPGLARGGFWLVLSLYVITGLTDSFVSLFERARSSQIDLLQLSHTLLLVIAAVVLISLCATSLAERVKASGTNLALWSPVLILPPVLAVEAANVALGVGYVFSENEAYPTSWHITLLQISAFVIIPPLFMFLYARSIKRAFPQEIDWTGKRAILGLLALVQAIICICFNLVPNASLGPGSGLIVLVVVLWSIQRALRGKAP